MLTAILAQAHKGSFWMPEQTSTVAADVDGLYDFIYYLSLFFFLLITVLLVAFIIKYRHRKDGKPHEPAAGHSTALELTWTIIPAVLVLVIFYFGFRGFMNMMVEPPDSYEVMVNGKTWSWEFVYEGQYVSDDGYLHIPVNTPVRLVLSSNDVIHSLFLPTFRLKKDVVPGRYNRFWVQATKTGTFDITCAEYCGQSHSQMTSKVVVHDQADFAKWLDNAKDWTKTKSPLEAGAQMYKTRGCYQCHSVDGTAGTGPTWKDMFGSQVPILGQGNVLADENYIRESIFYPQAKIHQGFPNPSPMSSFLGSLNDQDVGAIIAYMKSISVNFKGDLAPFKLIKPKSTTQPAKATTVEKQKENAPDGRQQVTEVWSSTNVR
jgi:cytochrome c oxidase subunit 2